MLSLVKCLFSYLIMSIFVVKSSDMNYNIKLKKQSISVSILWSLFFSFVFFLYSYYIIGFNESSYYYGDRANYYYDFLGRKTENFLFDKYYDIMRLFTDNFPFVVAFTTFLSCLIALIALRKSQYFNEDCIICFMISFFIWSSFTNQKQIFADAIAGLFFVLLCEYRKKVPLVIYILLIIAACGFHQAGYILIPLYFLIKKKFTDCKLLIYVLLFLLVLIFLNPILSVVEYLIRGIVPRLSNKIMDYSTSVYESESNRFLVALKGLPYYVVTIEGLVHRKNGRQKYEHYDSYLMISIFCSFTSLLSIVSYWYQRFPMLFIVPICLFVTMVIDSIYDTEKKLYTKMTIFGSFFLMTFRSVFLAYYNYGGY